ncbi:hypothetical protein MMC19_007503 [Ptychographa xylographoides]|nr:hypothetical protein [Ptychographa xylographoides]
MTHTGPQRRLRNPCLFICDLQEKFRPAIWEYPKILTTAQKLLKASQILHFPIYATTQLRSRLGETCAELGLDTVYATAAHVDKTAFSMYVPEIASALSIGGSSEVVIVGIEAHICVMQTTLDLLAHGHKVYVLADGVSSCNREEVPVALRRLAREGAVVTTSESFLYECMGDAGIAEFKAMSGLVKESKDSTREAMQTLCKI